MDLNGARGHAYRLLQTFEAIPQASNFGESTLLLTQFKPSATLWKLSDRHIHDDIEVKFEGDEKVVTIAEAAFPYVAPLLAEIEGVRGRFFSKRLHRAVVRFATNDGADRDALERILQERYGVSTFVPDYEALTGEPAGRFSEFESEELMAIVSMLEEFPKGMLKTPGLQYLVRRLGDTHNPKAPEAAALAHTGAGYIEFTGATFLSEVSLFETHRIILHEKAHFLWEYVFDDQLKSDWIALGGWFEDPNAPHGWSTTKPTEFVTAYAHQKNPNEDMAESIGFYIANPDKLRAHSPAKYEFIQDRIMHGTRYISKIREDLTFEVYNLYPDYVYPGRVTRVDIQVEGEPEEDKQITVEIEIHGTSAQDSAQWVNIRMISSQQKTESTFWLSPIDADGQPVVSGHIFRGHTTLSRYAANGYWIPDSVMISDPSGNTRFSSASDFGWQLYINNPLSDSEAPVYVKNSTRLSLSEATTEEGRAYQIVTARWKLIEKTGIERVAAVLNPAISDRYSGGNYNSQTGEASVDFIIPDYLASGIYAINEIFMEDIARNKRYMLFTDPRGFADLSEEYIKLDEIPATIDVQTSNPDTEPPVLDVNRITIQAEPTQPEAPNGETRVDIAFRVKDDISGYSHAEIYLRNPQGEYYNIYHSHPGSEAIYFPGDPTVYKVYRETHLLPIGSPPGTWGLAYMQVFDKAINELKLDFTEIVRFEVEEGAAAAPVIAMLPDNTQLLANFPNPFNPETWIPYQLTNASDVSISIYDMRGMLVRTLLLGYQSAGYYTSRGRAAYWDGRNCLGENVASGVYFYQLQADETSRMRKMVILK